MNSSSYRPPEPAHKNDRRVHQGTLALTEALTRRRFVGLTAVAALTPAIVRAAGTGIRPALQSVTPDSIWVGWRTDSGRESTVLYGTTTDLGSSATGTTRQLGTSYYWHAVQLTGLTPDTYYYYKVRTGSDESEIFRFRTLPPRGTKSGRRMRFLMLGDNQIRNEPRYETIIARAKATLLARYNAPIEETIDVFLNIGDQVDTGTLDHYQNVHLAKEAEVSPNLATMTMIGNHETYGNAISDPENSGSTIAPLSIYDIHFNYAHLTYGGITSPGGDRYYANHVANILFIHLNSEDTSTAQTNWVNQLVNYAKTDSQVDFIVSLVHRPYQAEQYVGDISSWYRNTIAPILATTPKHVLNVGGHHHLYARGQMREWPVYHIISGGTAWDQFWGQSTERDFDDVTMTIANWAWQVIEFDLDAKKMTVECFAEAHPKLGFVYPSKKIDQFHRQLGLPAPGTPALLSQPTAAVALPFTLESSGFTATSEEQLYSTWFQVATSNDFSNLKIDQIRDRENYYGDTGTPNYTPINIHASVDILKYTIPSAKLPNGTYYARVRHRDTNIEWSAWSPTVTFTVEGSTTGDPAISMAKKVYAYKEDMEVTFENGPQNTTDWIGIYKKGQTPGNVNSTTWAYLNGKTSAPSQGVSSGKVLFTADLAEKQEWYAVFLASDGYTQLGSRIPFYVGSTPTLTTSKTAYEVGDTVTINYANAPAGSKDWIGVYRAGQNPASVTSAKYSYITTASGALNYTGLAKGFYFTAYFVADGYFEISDRIAFSVGDEIATLQAASTSIQYGEGLTLTFASGPGTPKDYMGIFVKGATPGVDRLVTYLYVGGNTTGSITFTDLLPAGEYFAALYINDSYTAVSNPVEFTVAGGPEFPQLDDFKRGTGNNLVIGVKVRPGRSHRLEKSMDLKNWEPVQTFMGEGLRMDVVVPYDSSLEKAFWRVIGY